MDVIKHTIDDLPENLTIEIPKHLVHRKAEIIILAEEKPVSKKRLVDFFGALPDFPERFSQGEFEGLVELPVFHGDGTLPGVDLSKLR